MAVPTLLKFDGSLTHDSEEKAALFADEFERKQSNEALTMPQTCFHEAILIAFVFFSLHR